MAPGYTLTERAPLAALNTLRIAVHAECLVQLHDPDALPGVLALPAVRDGLLVLGDGSNVLLTRDVPGVVLTIRHDAVEPLADGHVRVGAGVNWHRFVHWSIAHGFTGLENLALIPGTVGAAPIQNIGAYGTELAEFVHTVRAFDRERRAWTILSATDCAFAYRDSVFKRVPERFVVAAVEFVLPRDRPLQLDYAGLRDELTTMAIDAPTAADVAQAVERIRRRKLPDPAHIGNAGSFFKNPTVSGVRAQSLLTNHPAMPHWPGADGKVKLSAAWLIERCGYKGARDGDAGIADTHALVLVNHGRASGAQLWAFAQRVQRGVEKEFGVRLEPEPRVV
ncbi:MAG: UDP-N-acetylmuramate dehydrogenase [Gammaproteobacteria bacterium]